MKYYIAADVHGFYTQFHTALEEAGWFGDTSPHKLVLLGDAFDRGPEAVKMQEFLLELGKGFLFEKRQKRFTFDEDHYFVDLVFYNRLLQCYVLIDLKINKLTHQDLGQMQMYVNYYDRYVKQPFEKPTVGILLCKEKKDAMVELTLPKDSNIYATEYALYLPDKKELQQKLQDWIEEFSEEEPK